MAATTRRRVLVSVNPATEEAISERPEHDDRQVDATLGAAQRIQSHWAGLPVARRAESLSVLARHLRDSKPVLAALVTAEMGKPIVEAENEVEKCAATCEWFAANAEELLAEQPVPASWMRSFVQCLPLGVVLAVMPWNYPIWQFFRAAIPALLAGNAIVLKPASNVAGCGIAIDNLCARAGLPSGLVSALLISADRVASVIGDPRIAGVTLTGSAEAGERVASAAGANLKKCVLELGGSDPFIVLADADVHKAATAACTSRFRNAGQACVAAKRFVVDGRVASEFTERLVSAASALVVGDPLDRSTQIGPLARRDLVDLLDGQIQDSVAAGARVLLGSGRIDGVGYFYRPTVLDGVPLSSRAFREETFGPVAAVVTVDGEAEAISTANDSSYGLGASIWTRDVDRGSALARRINAGWIAVNGVVASDARLPFGGVKRSGFGRELSAFGVHEFVNVQAVTVSS